MGRLQKVGNLGRVYLIIRKLCGQEQDASPYERWKVYRCHQGTDLYRPTGGELVQPEGDELSHDVQQGNGYRLAVSQAVNRRPGSAAKPRKFACAPLQDVPGVIQVCDQLVSRAVSRHKNYQGTLMPSASPCSVVISKETTTYTTSFPLALEGASLHVRTRSETEAPRTVSIGGGFRSLCLTAEAGGRRGGLLSQNHRKNHLAYTRLNIAPFLSSSILLLI